MKDKDQQLIFEAYTQGHTETYVGDKDKIKLVSDALIGQFGAKGKHYGVSAKTARELLDDQKPFLEILIKTDDGHRRPTWTFYTLNDKEGPVLAQHGRWITAAHPELEEWHKFLTDPETIRVSAVSLLGLNPEYNPVESPSEY